MYCEKCGNITSVTEKICNNCGTDNKISLVNERVAANCLREMEIADGGKIYFHKDHLLFKPHKFNVSTKEVRISYSDILKIEPKNNLGIIPNRLDIITKTNNRIKFVVNKRSRIVLFLTEIINEYRQ